MNIQNLTINIHQHSPIDDELEASADPAIIRDELVNLLRIISQDKRLVEQTVIIPDNCEQYGFAEGEFDLPTLLHFLADMLE